MNVSLDETFFGMNLSLDETFLGMNLFLRNGRLDETDQKLDESVVWMKRFWINVYFYHHKFPSMVTSVVSTEHQSQMWSPRVPRRRSVAPGTCSNTQCHSFAEHSSPLNALPVGGRGQAFQIYHSSAQDLLLSEGEDEDAIHVCRAQSSADHGGRVAAIEPNCSFGTQVAISTACMSQASTVPDPSQSLCDALVFDLTRED